MKTNSILLGLAVLSAMAVVFQSCSLTRNDDFTQRKYTKFHKGTEVAMNKAITKPEVSIKELSELPSTNTIKLALNGEDQIGSTVSTTVAGNVTDEISKPVFNKVSGSGFVKRSILSIPQRLKIPFASHHNTTAVTDDDTILLAILSFIFPPLAVYLKAGIGASFWLDVLLTLFFWIPGVIYALIVVLG